ncbi:MAG: SDR family oxidoreductase [Candidatus Korarchaeota archaeon]
MRVLVTGGAGYIGSVLVRMLIDAGYDVICLDRLFFGLESIQELLDNPNFKLVRDDIRWFNPDVLKGVDIVTDLAALSNDPTGELDPMKTYDINYLGRIRVARLSKECRVGRYIFASTCSVYGFQERVVNENSSLNPLTTYAKAAVLAEKDILPLASRDFIVTVLRFATAYGLSHRMRFDLVVNAMTLSLYKEGVIVVEGDGQQKRPLVHVRDICGAIMKVMEAEPEVVNGEVFNVGSNEQNYKIIDLANDIKSAIEKPCRIEFRGQVDRRSYEVDFTKIKTKLNYRTRYTVRDGAREIYRALEEGTIKDDLKTITVKWYKHLLEMHKLIKDIEQNGKIL